MIIHTVKRGESLYDIAREYCISPRMLGFMNGLREGARLYEGEELAVTIPTKTANIRRGESLDTVSKRFGTAKAELVSLNPELGGREQVYYGQSIAIKRDPALFGTAALNGYLYRGCSAEKLIAAMPYLCLITVSAGVADGGTLRLIMRDSEILELIRKNGRGALLRIYIEKMPVGEEKKSLIDALSIYLEGSSYLGVTLSLPKENVPNEALDELVLLIKKRLIEAERLLLVEREGEKRCTHTQYADGCILYYDKLHKKEIPTFTEGERSALFGCINECECQGIFLDVSPFAYYGDKYISEEEARGLLIKHTSGISYDKQRQICHSECAGKKRLPLLYESLYGTAEKAKLVSELALLGMSVDIARTSQKKYTVISSLLNLCTDPKMMSIINLLS